MCGDDANLIARSNINMRRIIRKNEVMESYCFIRRSETPARNDQARVGQCSAQIPCEPMHGASDTQHIIARELHPVDCDRVDADEMGVMARKSFQRVRNQACANEFFRVGDRCCAA